MILFEQRDEPARVWQVRFSCQAFAPVGLVDQASILEWHRLHPLLRRQPEFFGTRFGGSALCRGRGLAGSTGV
jgi:hypothetical protein